MISNSKVCFEVRLFYKDPGVSDDARRLTVRTIGSMSGYDIFYATFCV